MHIYCSGIGGIGLSAYAALQRANGHAVTGSDRAASALLDDLASQGIAIVVDQSGKHVPADADLFVYSEAIPEQAPERVRARELGIRQLSYPAALGELSAGRHVIAVCGTHGKSSTVAMAARMLVMAGKDPTVVAGTKIPDLDGKNWRKGASDLFLLEACEYRRSFQFYRPQVILLTNADGDHFDYYGSPEDYRNAFVSFVGTLPPGGSLITHLGDADCAAIAGTNAERTIDADAYPLLPLRTPGLHMQENAQLVLALAEHLHIPMEAARSAVSGYAGSWRRMELKGMRGGIPVIDDYAHHPREIRASLAAVRGQYPGRRVVCVFQPHTHDRTAKLYREFLTSFTDADVVIIPNIYDARTEMDSQTVEVDQLVSDIASASSVQALNGGSVAETERLLPGVLLEQDVLICMGAGDVTVLADAMAR